MYKAFRKYGFENFTFEILCITDKENVLVMEQFYINKGVDYNSCLIAGSLSGFRHSEDSKTRTIIKGEHHSAKKVDMYSLQGDFIKTFDSILEAQEETKIKSKSNITQCCKGKVFSAGGFRWALYGKELKQRPNRLGKHKVAIYNDMFYKEFDSQVDCAKYLKEVHKNRCNQGLVNRALRLNIKIYNFKIKRI